MMRTLLTMLTISAAAIAQQHPSLMEDASRENLPAQTLGADDLIGVSVYDAPELTRTVRIGADGNIHLPLLQAAIPAAGRLPREVEAGIASALEAEQILVNPVVVVTAAEYHSRPISVIGAVKKPLTFQAVGAVTLVDALARAEGLTEDAGTEILLSQPRQSSGEGESGATSQALVKRVAVKGLLKDADPSVNYLLHGGEEIRVPEAGRIFVVGNVKKPGAFPVRDDRENSVLKAMALSEGLLPYAAKLAYVFRRDESGAQREIPIALAKILERKQPDVPLEVGDVLYVPDSKARRNTAGVIDRVTGFGVSTASGILIWH